MVIVKKFGGTSVDSLEKISKIAEHIIKEKKKIENILVVVSAMGKETNTLEKKASYFSPNINDIKDKKALDMLFSSGERVTASLLSIALNQNGCKALCMSGRQAGIITCDSHTTAKIKYVDLKNINKAFKEGKVIIVTGFQGVNLDGNVTTLGRGGSDLSAVALAGVLKAKFCEIYTDVNGVFSTDPRIEENAKKIDLISYDEMLEFAGSGAKVLQTRSVELAKKLEVNIHTCLSFIKQDSNLEFNETKKGTYILKEDDIKVNKPVTGIALNNNQARISLISVKDNAKLFGDIFTKLTKNNINVDVIVKTKGENNRTNVDFTVHENEINKAKELIESFMKDDILDMSYDSNVCKVAVVGLGMKDMIGVASKTFLAMSKENINILMVTTSDIKISMIIDIKEGQKALRALHKEYELHKGK